MQSGSAHIRHSAYRAAGLDGRSCHTLPSERRPARVAGGPSCRHEIPQNVRTRRRCRPDQARTHRHRKPCQQRRPPRPVSPTRSTWSNVPMNVPLPRPPHGEALPPDRDSLHHRVRVDRQLRHHLAHLRQLVTRLQVAQTQRLLDLLDQLQIRRDPRSRIERERDRRASDPPGGRAFPAGFSPGRFADLLIYLHKTSIQR